MAYFSEQIIKQVWDKGKVISGYDPNIWRQDFAGAWINRNAYGITDNKYGWEIDHLCPLSKGGTDELGNLYPLQWENNRTKGNDYPHFKTSVSANVNRNVNVVKTWKVN